MSNLYKVIDISIEDSYGVTEEDRESIIGMMGTGEIYKEWDEDWKMIEINPIVYPKNCKWSRDFFVIYLFQGQVGGNR